MSKQRRAGSSSGHFAIPSYIEIKRATSAKGRPNCFLSIKLNYGHVIVYCVSACMLLGLVTINRTQ